jgi:hypothetical protein
MQGHHWLMLVLVLAIGYVLGVKFPSWGSQVGL